MLGGCVFWRWFRFDAFCGLFVLCILDFVLVLLIVFGLGLWVALIWVCWGCLVFVFLGYCVVVLRLVGGVVGFDSRWVLLLCIVITWVLEFPEGLV